MLKLFTKIRANAGGRALLAASTLLLLLGAGAARAAQQDWLPGAADDTPALRIRQAFDYAFPLVAMGRLRGSMLGSEQRPGHSSLNVWLHQRKLSGPQDRWVTTPNNDTVYSTLWLDLRQGPVLLSTPDMGGRYFSLAFMDMATNNFEVLGRRTSGTRAGAVIVVGPDSTQPLPAGMQVVRAPANDVLVLARILVSGDADLPKVLALQQQFKVEPAAPAATPPRWAGETAPAIADSGAPAFVALANLMLERNPPPRYETALLQRLTAVGLCGAACSWEALSPELKALWTAQLPAMLATLKGGLAAAGARADGWSYSKDDLGNFGTDYAYRAQVALGGLLALPPAEAMYPITAVDSAQRSLSGAHRYRLRLEPGAIPVNGFWSLSMYERMADGKLFFTPNAIGVYALGDRSEGLRRNADGSVDIAMQREAPDAPQLNWLPTPAGDFVLVLRAYEPKAELRDGRVHLPAVQRLD